MIDSKYIIIGIIIFIIFLSNKNYEHYLAYIPWNLATRPPRYSWDIRGNPFFYPWYGSREMPYPLDLFPWYPGVWNSVLSPYSYNADGSASVLANIKEYNK
jgi:hypothetical protein